MLEFIFITILVIWLLGIVGRFFARRWLAKKQREFAEQLDGAQRQQNSKTDRKNSQREGEISVQQTATAEKKVNKSVGDYVEFEEMEIIEETNDTE